MTLDTTILIARHGQTPLNALKGKLQGGDSDGPLNQLNLQGKEQANQLGKLLAQKKIEIEAFYSSDLGRANETAEIVRSYFPNKTSVIKKIEFREMRHGSHEGVITDAWDAYAKSYFSVLKEKANGTPDRAYKWNTTPFQGEETVSQLFERLTDGIVQITENHPGKTVFVCSHRAAIKTLTIGCTTPPEEELKHYIEETKSVSNCAIAVFKCTPGAGKSSIKFEGLLDLEKSL